MKEQQPRNRVVGVGWGGGTGQRRFAASGKYKSYCTSDQYESLSLDVCISSFITLMVRVVWC